VLVDAAGLVLTAHWHRASPRNDVP
jgi:hypothetical protein